MTAKQKEGELNSLPYSLKKIVQGKINQGNQGLNQGLNIVSLWAVAD